jgi:predicted nucleic acid-binding protein
LIVVDSNIFIDMLSPNAEAHLWSRAAFESLSLNHEMLVNAPIAAEISAQFSDAEQLTRYFYMLQVDMKPIALGAAFAAGTAHALYRKRGGERQSILADFLIAGHAVDLKAQILTRDAKRYRSYFPDINLITPETHP